MAKNPMWCYDGKIIAVLPGSGWREAYKQKDGRWLAFPVLAWILWEYEDDEYGEGIIRTFVPIGIDCYGVQDEVTPRRDDVMILSPTDELPDHDE